jgi:hypothetical protein
MIRMVALPGLDDSQHAQGVRRGWASLTAGAWLSGLISTALLAAAAREFREVRTPRAITLSANQAEIITAGDLVYGRLKQGLPPRRLHWDGEPARAVLLDESGVVVAPPLLMASSLSLNRRGVLWTEEDCRFVVERSAWDASGARLRLECEAIESSLSFYLLAGLALAACLGAILCGQIRRVYQSEVAQRRAALAAELRLSSFVLLSLYTAAACYPGLPFMATNPDAINIYGFAAGRDAPDMMQHDSLLGDPQNYTWYTPAYVEFVRWWKAAGFHYGVGTAFLALASSLLGLAGFERLFRAASGSLAFAWLAAVAVWFMRTSYPPNESWNIVQVLPRTVFSGLLPWVVLAAIAVRSRPRLWSVASAFSALLFYVHPVSSPALTGAVLMGLVVAGEGALWKRLAWGAVAACAALAVMLPYSLVYAAKYSGTVADDPALMLQAAIAARERFAQGFLDLDYFLMKLGWMFLKHPRFWIGFACAAWLVRRRRNEWPVRLGMGMAAGYAIVTFAIPALDLTLASHLGRLPFQVDLMRNVRYLDIFVLVAAGLCVREMPRFLSETAAVVRAWLTSLRPAAARSALQGAKLQVAVTVLLVLYFQSTIRPFTDLGRSIVRNVSLLTGDIPEDIALEWELVRVLQSVRRAEEVVSGPLFLRASHIPLAWLQKDLGCLAYANPRELVAAKTQLERAAELRTWPMTQERLNALAGVLNAQLIVLEDGAAASDSEVESSTVFRNEKYVVARASPKGLAEAGPDSRRKTMARDPSPQRLPAMH